METSSITVLVVEDEALIRMTVVDELEDNGFTVLEAGNADEAVRIIASNPSITVVFTDVDMPGSMNGAELAVLVRARHPELAVIVTSGYLKVPRSFLPLDVAFFSKPYRIETVVKEIRASHGRQAALSA
jgi:DNA-binding NtrC family response regulator